jgi:hypothetical protein
MHECDPKFAKFSAKVNGMSVSWSSKEPFLTGDQELIDLIQKELSVELGYKVTATGPFVYSDVQKAAPVYLALLAMFGDTVVFKNPPNLDRLWLEPWMLDEDGKFIPGLVF